MTPRVLLLQEDNATGGITTMANTLSLALREEGWHITPLLLTPGHWRDWLTAARGCDVLVASHNFRPSYVAWLLSLLLAKPVVVWVHGPLQEVLTQARASAFKRAWLKFLYRRIPRFVFVSQATCDSFMRFMGVPLSPHQRSHIISNAVSQAHLQQPSSPPPSQSETPWELAYIGRLSAEKQPLMLLDMLRLLPAKYRLTLVGDGPLRETVLDAGADLLSSGRLTLAGAQAHGLELYRPWQLTLLASLYEGCPMTLLESFVAGVPCVALPIPATQEILGTEAAFMLARDASVQALADAVRRVLALSHQETTTAMALVLARHRLKDFVQRWQDVLREATRPC